MSLTTPDPAASPGAPRRAMSRVRTNIRGASLALVFAVVVQVAFLAGLVFFDHSLQHHLPGHRSCPPTVEATTVAPTTTPTTASGAIPGVPGVPGSPTGGGGTPVSSSRGIDCGVAGNGLIAARTIETILGLAGMLVIWFGVRALLFSLRSRRLTAEGEHYRARIAAEDSRDAVWYVVGIGLTVGVLAFFALLLGSNGGAVRTVLFNWKYPLRSLHAMLTAFLWNVKMFLVTEVLVLVWALIVAVIRQLPGRPTAPIRWLAIAYTDAFRGVPAVMVIYLIGFGFSLAGVWPFSSLHGDAQLFWLGVLALTVVYGAYVAEVYRAGIESIHWSQAAAARSLGLSQWQTYRYVVVPQAVRRIIPPLLNDFVALQKDTALVGFVGLIEVLNESTLLNSRYFNLTAITFAALMFLVLTIPLTRFVDYLIKRDQQRTRAG